SGLATVTESGPNVQTTPFWQPKDPLVVNVVGMLIASARAVCDVRNTPARRHSAHRKLMLGTPFADGCGLVASAPLETQQSGRQCNGPRALTRGPFARRRCSELRQGSADLSSYTSQSVTASRSDVSGSRVGTNSCAM